MNKQLKRSQIICVGIYAVILGISLASLFFPQTGKLSIIRNAGRALLLLSTAVFAGYAAFFQAKPRWLVIPIAICAVTTACFGAVRTVHVLKDISSGPQIVELTNCKLLPDYSADIVVVTGGHLLTGTDENGKVYEFPLTAQEYRSLARKMETPADTWSVKATAYLHCQRMVTFTAEKATTENGGAENVN